MKPSPPAVCTGARESRRFPCVEQFFLPANRGWPGGRYGDDGDEPRRRRAFRNISRDFFGWENRRHWWAELMVFCLLVVLSAWPVIELIVIVVRLLHAADEYYYY